MREYIVIDKTTGSQFNTGPLSRLFFAVSLAFAVTFTNYIVLLGLILLFAFGAIVTWGGQLSALAKALPYSILLAIFLLILHLFSHQGKAYFSFIGFQATREGFFIGIVYALKLFAFIFSAMIIFLTIEPQELIDPLERLAGKLGPFGKPLESLALSLFLTLRFLPEFIAMSHITYLAFETKGVNFRGGLFHKAKVATLLAAPLIVISLKRAETAALALNIKGYATRHLRAVYPPSRITLGSVITFMVSIVIISVGWSTRL